MSAGIVVVAGGIGSGKSVVSRILRTMGYDVYDCDTEAKSIMDNDCRIKQRIRDDIDSRAVCAGRIDRRLLADIVFSDKDKLEMLNHIVHQAVRDDICAWAGRHTDKVVFVETAIPKESGIDRMADAVWWVDAPVETRISRVMLRNDVTREAVLKRMASQQSRSDDILAEGGYMIINDGDTPVLPRIHELLGIL